MSNEFKGKGALISRADSGRKQNTLCQYERKLETHSADLISVGLHPENSAEMRSSLIHPKSYQCTISGCGRVLEST